ncbi:hypothetical protein IAQ61_005495 [Plenodomus lingam]|uniref:Similar to Ankyrin and HET domain protein n=1 Tax=Leptosphaeria maculans (strain JN3 / isolate v23.1.3 / race Av1-4-5-6-7-8) TaxID=985895 RepID=E4ZZ46_LEPMJ|nr:similar to Ankyrin and HET domain protein [Plenodomus lingam JN3]KAH9871316.1 hypothetical protein IAQ61_005495 [Plenodomus lingam]CBX96641.1 similar to Ankyrin and HET domain protein [Plenodomus lingam JN3]
MKSPSFEVLPGLYSPLPTASSIRLLEIHPRVEPDDAVLSCTLRVESLEDQKLNYHALSYTWGDPLFRNWWDGEGSERWSNNVPIVCNGIKVMVTYNLMTALKTISQCSRTRFGSHTGYPRLWVDFLSINQSDTRERSSQVNMMARIYGKASLVISWLGPADDASELAIPLIERLKNLECVQNINNDYSAAPQYSITLNRRHWVNTDFTETNPDDISTERLGEADAREIVAIGSRHYQSLVRFLARRYFFRCWVLQELMLGKELCMLCGTQEVQLSDLHKVAVFVSSVRKLRPDGSVGQALSLPMKGPRGFEHERAIIELWQHRQQLMKRPQSLSPKPLLTFAHLLALARVSGCRDPRDKIYSLLGLLPHETFKLRPDYEQPLELVYGYAIRYWINESRTLNCLSWVADEADRRFPNLPTWIGELENTINQQELAFTAIVHDATEGSSIQTAVSLAPENAHVLPARGVNTDRIIELAQTREEKGFGIDCRLWASMTLQMPQIYPFTGQARGEALFQTLVAGEINNVPFSSKRHLPEFTAIVRRDTGFAIIRELHRLKWYSATSNKDMSYDNSALSLLQDMDALAMTDSSNFIVSWTELRELESKTCTCNANLTHADSSHQQPSISPDPDCLYVKDTVRRLNGLYPHCESVKPDRPSSPISVPDAQGWEHGFRMALDHKLHSRRLARTEKGYFALVPAGSELGDAVWLLQGARVPFIMRKAQTTGSEAGASSEMLERWNVVGDAYVHGMMQGEAWKKGLEKELESIELV